MENVELKYELITGLRRDSILLYIESEKQLYKQKNVYRNNIRYVCYEKNCNVSVMVMPKYNKCTPLSKNREHRHPIKEEFINKLKLLNMKTECDLTICPSLKRSGTREIFVTECRKKSAHLVQFNQIRRNVCPIKRNTGRLLGHAIKNSSIPENPTHPLRIKKMFELDYFLSRHGMSKYNILEPFYQETIIEDDFSYTIFISPSIVQLINSSEDQLLGKYLLDTIFPIKLSCGYKQLLIIHIQHNDEIYPFIFILMSNKSQALYENIFQFIDTNLFEFKPTLFHTDYDEAIRNALKTVFPQVTIKGCWFHFCQALCKNSQKVDKFPGNLQNNKYANRIFSKLMILPLLKPEDIVKAVEILRKDVDRLPTHSRILFQQFLVYFDDYWMGGNKECPATMSMSNDSTRTTRAIEDYHFHLSLKLAEHFHFFKFLDSILDEDLSRTLDLRNSLNGVPNTESNLCPELIEATIKLDKKEITLTEFLNQLYNLQNKHSNNNNSSAGEEDSDNASDGIEEVNPNIFVETREILSFFCINCHDKPKEVLFQPCNHAKICTDCFAKISRKAVGKKEKIVCPCCSHFVENSIKIIF